jgi:hypothetical protein
MELVLGMQGKSFHPLFNYEWLYASIQVAVRLNEMFGKIIAFDRQLRLSELQLRSECVNRF